MASCCPISWVGFDPISQLHKHYTVVCGSWPLDYRFCWSVNRMAVGGCNQGVCSVPTIACADPIPFPDLPRKGPGSDVGLKRAVYRRGVPNPANPDGRPDVPFVPEDSTMILAEYTCDYQAKKASYWARLMTIGLADRPGALCHFGWQLDPESPLSPLPTAHFSGKWITSVQIERCFHIVEIKNVGKFMVQVVQGK